MATRNSALFTLAGTIERGTACPILLRESGTILAQHGRLSVDANTLDEDSDLYGAGLTSLATVGIMLALEDHFNVEFHETMLSRKTFGSLFDADRRSGR